MSWYKIGDGFCGSRTLTTRLPCCRGRRFTIVQLSRRLTRSDIVRRVVVGRANRLQELQVASALLGRHRLVRSLDLLYVLSRQLQLGGLALIAAAIALASDTRIAWMFVCAAAAVDVVLLAAIALLRGARKEAARQLIIEYGNELPIRAIEKECRRLSRRDTLDRLACSCESFAYDSTSPRPAMVANLVFSVDPVRAIAPLLLEVADRIRAQPADPRPAARLEQLLTSGSSALYGGDPAALRDELHHILAELSRRPNGRRSSSS